MTKYYIHIENGKINGKGNTKIISDGWENIEVTKDIFDGYDEGKYICKNGEIKPNPEYENILLDRAKAEKVALNDELRDKALLGGVTYQGVLFDSDTDQKVNLLATVGLLDDDSGNESETDSRSRRTITWYGMDNKALLCTEADLLNIGALITELHSYCWNMNAHIKEQIEGAQTIEELGKIEISYDREMERLYTQNLMDEKQEREDNYEKN